MNYLRFTDDILLIANIPEELKLIIELNGTSKAVGEESIGKLGHGKRNELCEDFINLSAANGFKIVNSYFQKNHHRGRT